MQHDAKFLEDLGVVREKVIEYRGNLCGFMEVCEREVMVAQTITAAGVNLRDHGEPFSIRGGGVMTGRAVCGTNNRAGYEYLIDNGYFVEQEREVAGKKCVVIFPTRKLLDKLIAYFKL